MNSIFHQSISAVTHRQFKKEKKRKEKNTKQNKTKQKRFSLFKDESNEIYKQTVTHANHDTTNNLISKIPIIIAKKQKLKTAST